MNNEYICCMFDEEDPEKAYKEADWDIVRRYGETAICHDGYDDQQLWHITFNKGRETEELQPIYEIDAGWRNLCRCKKCRGLLLVHRDEHHDPYRRDIEFTRIIPVKSIHEADSMCLAGSEYLGLNNLNKLDRIQLEYSYGEEHENDFYRWVHGDKELAGVEIKRDGTRVEYGEIIEID